MRRNHPERVFQPDDAAYDYHRDGSLYDLPVSAAYDHFVLKGAVGEAQKNGNRSNQGRDE